jgi:Phage tail tube protein
VTIGPAAGVVYFKIKESQYRLPAMVKIQPNSMKNEWIANQDGTSALLQRGVVTWIEIKVDSSEQSVLRQLMASPRTAVTVELDDGRVFNVYESDQWGAAAHTHGEITVKFGGTVR